MKVYDPEKLNQYQKFKSRETFHCVRWQLQTLQRNIVPHTAFEMFTFFQKEGKVYRV
jgi:hypothetical protein